jgi:predicted Zn-ribbon and HTH transcriptional regulator
VAQPFFEFLKKMPKIGKSSKNSGQPVVKYPPFCQKNGVSSENSGQLNFLRVPTCQKREKRQKKVVKNSI